MINRINEIVFNNEANLKSKESKNEKYKGFNKLVEKFSKEKNELDTLKSTKNSKRSSLEVKDGKTMEIKDSDREESLKNIHEQLYLLIQDLFFEYTTEGLENFSKEGNDLGSSIEKLILNIVEDVDFKKTLDGINIKDLGLEEINKEEFNKTLETFLQSPKGEEEILKKIKTTISSLNREEVLSKEEINLNKDNDEKNIKIIEENIHTKVETKKENFSKNFSKESFNKEGTSEDKVLENILGNKEDSKVSKAVNFMNQFNKIANVENLEIENIVINKETLNTDVIKAVKYMELNDMKNLTVKINPKDLGELVIKITMESGKMKANITANNKEAFNLLNANLQDITDKLQRASIKIENFSLNLYEDTTFFNKDKDRSQEGFKENKKNNLKTNLNIENDVIEDKDSLEDLSNISILA